MRSAACGRMRTISTPGPTGTGNRKSIKAGRKSRASAGSSIQRAGRERDRRRRRPSGLFRPEFPALLKGEGDEGIDARPDGDFDLTARGERDDVDPLDEGPCEELGALPGGFVGSPELARDTRSLPCERTRDRPVTTHGGARTVNRRHDWPPISVTLH